MLVESRGQGEMLDETLGFIGLTVARLERDQAKAHPARRRARLVALDDQFFLVFLIAGWIRRQQLIVIEYLKTENRPLPEGPKRYLISETLSHSKLSRQANAIDLEMFRNMLTGTNEVAEKLLGQSYESLDEHAKKIARHIAEGKHIARNAAKEFDANATPSQRAADVVANFGGSWTFLGIFAVACAVWVGLNSYIFIKYEGSFDPYPFIFLNLVLSLLAAIQAPIILMSQNRQAERDRLHGEHDYEVNLKTELEIMLLHEKIDLLRAELGASRMEPTAFNSKDADR